MFWERLIDYAPAILGTVLLGGALTFGLELFTNTDIAEEFALWDNPFVDKTPMDLGQLVAGVALMGGSVYLGQRMWRKVLRARQDEIDSLGR